MSDAGAGDGYPDCVDHRIADRASHRPTDRASHRAPDRASAPRDVVELTNTSTAAFGPINMFGGAPPTAEFNASQDCQGNTLAAGGTCMVTYVFSPTSPGAFTDTSSFIISQTANQADGFDFDVNLSGGGV